jgi:tRNA threonylcarbamoyl adenosine modification protein (Sua5/YciO/YrdC/YwlC family)
MRIFSDADLEEVARCLDDGAVVGIPTDTVYGLAASLNVPDAVRSLFTVKGRPETVPLPVLADSLSTVEECVGELDSNSRILATAYWPGPLTIIVPGPQVLCELVGSTAGTLGVRVPNMATIHRLLIRTGPLAVTSANLHGDDPCTTASAVADLFDSAVIAGVLDGGVCANLPSSVVEVVEGKPQIRRVGTVSLGSMTTTLGL